MQNSLNIFNTILQVVVLLRVYRKLSNKGASPNKGAPFFLWGPCTEKRSVLWKIPNTIFVNFQRHILVFFLSQKGVLGVFDKTPTFFSADQKKSRFCPYLSQKWSDFPGSWECPLKGHILAYVPMCPFNTYNHTTKRPFTPIDEYSKTTTTPYKASPVVLSEFSEHVAVKKSYY